MPLDQEAGGHVALRLRERGGTLEVREHDRDGAGEVPADPFLEPEKDFLFLARFDGVRYAEIPVKLVGPVPDLVKHVAADWDWLRGVTLKVGVCHGTANAKKVMENIKAGGQFAQCHLIEFMGCPGGCLGGGGQPIPTSPEIRAARTRAIYEEDSSYTVRKSHENPAVLRLYKEFLTEGPCGHLSHKLLHTHYTARTPRGIR